MHATNHVTAQTNVDRCHANGLLAAQTSILAQNIMDHLAKAERVGHVVTGPTRLDKAMRAPAKQRLELCDGCWPLIQPIVRIDVLPAPEAPKT